MLLDKTFILHVIQNLKESCCFQFTLLVCRRRVLSMTISRPDPSLRSDEGFCWRPPNSISEVRRLDSLEVRRLEGSGRDGRSERDEAPRLNR